MSPRPRLQRVHLRGTEADAAQLAGLCGATVSPGAPPALAEGPLREKVAGLRCGGRWVECLRLTRYPEAEVEPGWLWQLLEEPADLDISLHIAPRPAHSTERHLRRRQRGLEARALAASGSGAGPELEAAGESLTRLRRVLARGEGRLYEVGIALAVARESREGAAAAARGLRQRAAALRAALSPAWLDELPAMLESAGTRVPPRRAVRLLETSELVTCWPWLQGAGEARAHGYRIGRHARTGNPVGLDSPGEGVGPNANCCVIATSGGGKSYLAGVVGLEAAARGHRTVVVDPESEHRRWCLGAGGEYLDLGPEAGLGFNVLESGDASEAALAALELAALLAGPLGASEAATFLDSVGSLIAAAAPRRPRMGECVEELRGRPEAVGLVARLRPWVSGGPGEVFNGRGRGPRVTSVLGIGLRELPSTWVPGAAWLVSQWLWAWARTADGPKQLIVDEAGLLAEHRGLWELMGQMARRIRKYQGALLLLTQAAQDLSGAGFGELVAANAATVLLGGQSGPAAERLQLGFDLEDHHREWLRRAGRGQFLLVAGSTRVKVVVEAGRERHALLAGPIGRGPDPGHA